MPEAQVITKHCNDHYSPAKEDKTPLNLLGWIPISITEQFTNISKLCPAPWRYSQPQASQLLPNWGFLNTYGAGGYVADLGYSKETAVPMISSLRSNGWIDRYTRAVLLEFTIYNPYTGYLSIATYYYEMLPTGYGNTFTVIYTLSLTSTESGLYQFYLICQLLFIIIVFVSILQEVHKAYRQRCAYFRNVWNLIEILQLASSSMVVIFYVFKSRLVLKKVLKLKQNPFMNVSFQDVIVWNEAENAALALTIFIATLKILRMIRFNSHVILLLQSFRRSKELLVSYSLLFIVILTSYGLLGKLAFGGNLYRYSSLLRSVVTELLMALGGNMQVHEMRVFNRILGPFFVFSFAAVMSFIFVNFFVVILNDSYEVAKEDTDRNSEEYELGDFLLGQLAGILGFGKKTSDQEKKEETMKESSLSSTNSSCSHKAKPPKKPPLGALEELSDTGPAMQMEKELISAIQNQRKKIKMPLKHKQRNKRHLKSLKTTDEQERKQATETEYAVSAYEERISQQLNSLTLTSIKKDDVREDVELLWVIWLLSEEKNRASSPNVTSHHGGINHSSISQFLSETGTSNEGWCALEDEREDEPSGQASDRQSQCDRLDGTESTQATPTDDDDGNFYS